MKMYKLKLTDDPLFVGSRGAPQLYFNHTDHPLAREMTQGICNQVLLNDCKVTFLSMDPDIIPTDFLSLGGNVCGYLVLSSRLWESMSKFMMPPIQILEAEIWHGANSHNYRIINFLSPAIQSVDFQRMKFKAKVGVFGSEVIDLKIDSLDDLLAADRKYYGIHGQVKPASPYYFTRGFVQPDLLHIGVYDLDHYFSEDLVRCMRDLRISGADFLEVDSFV